ncbi:MAG TPA: Ig-like domain-containing protein [Gemmatimonadaceae bacterium]|nr:Ig-like domain-containing protein [Gemmatimonadaceae bacterium]
MKSVLIVSVAARSMAARVLPVRRQLVMLGVVLAACSGGESTAPEVTPAHLTVLSGQVGSTASGFETAELIAVKLTDNSNNPMAGQAVTFSVVAGGGSVSATTVNTGADGIARTSWTVGNPGAQTLRATAGSLNVDITANAVSCSEITLAVGQVQSLNPANAACAILNGSAQRYFVTIVNATNSPGATLAYKTRGASSATASQLVEATTMSSTVTPALSDIAGKEIKESLARSRMHALILKKNMELLQYVRSRTPATALRLDNQVALVSAPLALGDVIQMKLPDITINGCTSFTPVAARVVYVGTRGIMLEDTSNPLKGQVDTLYTRIGQQFDNVMFPILKTNFGNPLAMDAQLNNDGAMYMLFSAKVNTMGTGLIAGFVNNGDFFPPAQCPASNFAEVFYARSPTALGTVIGEPVAAWEFTRSIASTIIHEAKHLTSFATKLAQPGFPGGTPPEDGWLEESSAEIAQELLDRVDFSFSPKTNVDYASTIAKEVRPSSGLPMNMLNAFGWLYKYVANSEGLSVVGSTAPGDVTFYGSGWAFLRWAIDTYATSEPAFLTAMTGDVSHFGMANIENITGKSFPQLLSEYSLALVLDDYPGFTPTDSRYSFPSWNLRQVFAGLNADFQSSFPSVAPLNMHSNAFGKFSFDVSSVRGGGFSVLELSGTQTSRQLLEFKGSNGGSLPGALRVNIVRVQ